MIYYCNTNYKNVTVTVIPPAEPIVADQEICKGTSAVLQVSPTVTGMTYQWSSGATGAS